MSEQNDVMRALALTTRDYVTKMMSPLIERIIVLDTKLQAVTNGKDGRDGKDAEVDYDQIVTKAVALIPKPSDGLNGKDAAPVDIEDIVTRVLAAIHIPAAEKGDKGDMGPQGMAGIDGKDAPAVDVEDIVSRVLVRIPVPKDGAKGEKGDAGAPGLPGRDGLSITGPQGPYGPTGLNGLNGRDGTLEQMKVRQDADNPRSVTLCFKNGDPIEGGELFFPIPLYRGTYKAGEVYELGDTVTYANSTWYCHAGGTVTPPGDGSKLWQLSVRAGRDGKDLRPIVTDTTLPVVKTK